MKTIGLTGNIASGKSTVARMLVDRGAAHLDADRLVHELYAPGSEVTARIADHFGDGVLDSSGGIDRRALGAIVFSDDAALAALEGIVHPYTTREIAARVAAAARQPEPPPALVIEAVKLIEVGRHRDVDSTWIVIADPEVQRERLIRGRGWSAEEAEARIRAQAPLEPRLPLVDVIIENSGSLDALEAQVDRAWRQVVNSG
jgi:dephospho-CoA kinase